MKFITVYAEVKLNKRTIIVQKTPQWHDTLTHTFRLLILRAEVSHWTHKINDLNVYVQVSLRSLVFLDSCYYKEKEESAFGSSFRWFEVSSSVKSSHLLKTLIGVDREKLLVTRYVQSVSFTLALYNSKTAHWWTLQNFWFLFTRMYERSLLPESLCASGGMGNKKCISRDL